MDLRGCTHVCSDKAGKVKCGKENRRPRVWLSCQKEDFKEKGNPAEQLRTNGSVHECVCMRSGKILRRLQARRGLIVSSSSSDTNLHFGICYKAKRMRPRSVTFLEMKRQQGHSVVVCYQAACRLHGSSEMHERGSFCGSWLLSHSSSTSPAPKDCSAWIIQPARIVNERFVITSPPRGAPSLMLSAFQHVRELIEWLSLALSIEMSTRMSAANFKDLH